MWHSGLTGPADKCWDNPEINEVLLRYYRIAYSEKYNLHDLLDLPKLTCADFEQRENGCEVLHELHLLHYCVCSCPLIVTREAEAWLKRKQRRTRQLHPPHKTRRLTFEGRAGGNHYTIDPHA